MDELWEERPEKYMLTKYEYGFIKLNKPLIIDYINSNDSGWKRTVSDMFNGLTGKRLSTAIKYELMSKNIRSDYIGYFDY